jgi:hypothetical protein
MKAIAFTAAKSTRRGLRSWTMAALLLPLLTVAGKLWAQSPPVVTLTPASLTATNTDTNVTFTATLISGDTPATYEWHWVDTNNVDWVLPETTTNISIPIVSPTDAGGYYVIVDNDAGETNSTTNTLTVVTPPSVPIIQTVYTQDYGFDPLNTTDDLLLGLTDPYIAVPAMTDGSDDGGVPTGSGFYAFGGGGQQTFDLYAPCDIYEIDTYSGCSSAAGYNGIQVDQNYTVSVSSNNGVGYSTLYAAKGRMSLYNADAAPADMQVQLTPNNGGTVLASNVDHIRFTFSNDADNPNLYVYYMEFIAYGSNTLAPGKPIITTDVPASVIGTYLLSYSISVGVLGNPIPTFQWFLITGGTTNAIAGATNSTYSVAQAQLTNNLEKYQVVITNLYGSVTSAVSTVTLLGVVKATNTIYQDTFARVGGLVGSTPSPVNASNATWVGWNNPTQLTTDGSKLDLTNAEPVGGIYPNAFLPFTPSVGHVYTLSANISPIGGGNQWLALGYALTPITNNYYAAGTCGAGWLLERGNDSQAQLFLGPGTGNKLINLAEPGATNAFRTYSIVLDTTTGSASIGWTVTYYTNGVQVAQGVFSPNPPIQYVGLGADDATGYFENFTLTDVGYVTIQPLLTAAGQTANQFTLSWPSVYQGWTLQSNSVGLLASNSWVAVPGSTSTNQMPIIEDQPQASVFFRLIAP